MQNEPISMQIVNIHPKQDMSDLWARCVHSRVACCRSIVVGIILASDSEAESACVGEQYNSMQLGFASSGFCVESSLLSPLPPMHGYVIQPDEQTQQTKHLLHETKSDYVQSDIILVCTGA